MKIHPSIVTNQVGSTPRSREVTGKLPDRADAARERVDVSDAARFVERIREAVREQDEPVRAVEVARIREQLAAGTYESTVDLDRVVDRLLGDL
jgi:anti-sigma28 factor (negative regulator of flagellin synthesis)